MKRTMFIWNRAIDEGMELEMWDARKAAIFSPRCIVYFLLSVKKCIDVQFVE